MPLNVYWNKQFNFIFAIILSFSIFTHLGMMHSMYFCSHFSGNTLVTNVLVSTFVKIFILDSRFIFSQITTLIYNLDFPPMAFEFVFESPPASSDLSSPKICQLNLSQHLSIAQFLHTITRKLVNKY